MTHKINGSLIRQRIIDKYGSAKKYYLAMRGKYFTDIEMSQISLIVNKNRNITAATVTRICVTLDITPNMIIGNPKRADLMWSKSDGDPNIVSVQGNQMKKLEQELAEFKRRDILNTKKLSVLKDTQLEVGRLRRKCDTQQALIDELERELKLDAS